MLQTASIYVLLIEKVVYLVQTVSPDIGVPDSKSRNIPEVVFVRRGAVGVLGIWEGWDSWVKGGANGVSLQAT
jgi:hypothetical protein